MANHWPTFWQDIGTLVEAAFPGMQWWRDSDLKKTDWEQAYRNDELTLPFVVVFPENFGRWARGPMDREWLEGDVVLTYVVADNETDEGAFLENQMAALSLALFNTPLTTIQFRGEIVRDAGLQSEANRALLAQKLPDTAGTITFRCVMPGVNV